MTNNRLNGTDWTKQLISRILQITHSQWIYRNISLHDKSNGYLRNKNAEELAEEIHRLAKLQPEDLPTESKFLLEIDSGKLIKEHVETQAYWVIAVKAARKAKAAQSARSVSQKRRATSEKEDTRQDLKQAKSWRNREIIRDRLNNQECGGSTTIFEEHNQSFLDKFVEKRPHSLSIK